MNNTPQPHILIIGHHSCGLVETVLNSIENISGDSTGSLVMCSIDLSTLDDSNKQLIHLIPVDENGMVIGIDGRSWKYNADNILNSVEGSSVRIPGDYHHASINAANTGAKAPASGWVEPSTITAEADGIWGIVEWTTEAANAIRNKEYLYISPVFTANKATGETQKLKGFALTHYPNLGDLTPVANQQTTEDSKMDELLEKIRWMLNLPELATEEEVLAELEKAVSRIQSMLGNSTSEANAQKQNLIELLTGLEAQMTSLAANSQQDPGAFVPRTEFDTLKTKFDTITAAAETERVETAVNSALEKGLIAPASKGWAENYAKNDAQGFEAFCANAAQVVPLGEHEHEQPAAGALTDDEINMCTQLGLNQEDFKKTKELEVSHGAS